MVTRWRHAYVSTIPAQADATGGLRAAKRDTVGSKIHSQTSVTTLRSMRYNHINALLDRRERMKIADGETSQHWSIDKLVNHSSCLINMHTPTHGLEMPVPVHLPFEESAATCEHRMTTRVAQMPLQVCHRSQPCVAVETRKVGDHACGEGVASGKKS